MAALFLDRRSIMFFRAEPVTWSASATNCATDSSCARAVGLDTQLQRSRLPRSILRSELRSVLRRCENAAATMRANCASSRATQRRGRSGVSRTTADSTLGTGSKRQRRHVEQFFQLETVLQHDGQPPVIAVAGRCDHAFDDFFLQHDVDVADRARAVREMKQQRRRDVVGQIADHAQALAQRGEIELAARRPCGVSGARANSLCAAPARGRDRSRSHAVAPTAASRGRVSAPRPGPISTRRSPGAGSMAATIAVDYAIVDQKVLAEALARLVLHAARR